MADRSRERLALAILLYTGLRRGDAVQLGRQHIRDGIISMRTEKTGTPVTIPLLPELAEVIAASKTGDLAFIATITGTPMKKNRLEIGSAKRARPPASPAPRVGCARPARREPRTMARP